MPIIAEPDVALTDYVLTLECALFAWLLHREPRTGVRVWFVVFFCAIGVASLLGGTDHGFMHDKGTALRSAVWKATLVAIGVSSLAAWMIGAHLIARPAMPWVATAARVLFVVYLFVLTRTDTFRVAIIHYLPAVLFLMIVFALQYVRSRLRHYLWGVVGLLLTFAAAGVQQAGIGLHHMGFDHNALYHLIQAVALLFLFVAGREIVRRRNEASRPEAGHDDA